MFFVNERGKLMRERDVSRTRNSILNSHAQKIKFIPTSDIAAKSRQCTMVHKKPEVSYDEVDVFYELYLWIFFLEIKFQYKDLLFASQYSFFPFKQK